MSEKERRYKIAYAIEHKPQGLTKQQIYEADMGGCDAIIVTSIVRSKDGGQSNVFISKDGETGMGLPDDELFKSWSMMASHLAESDQLDEGKRVLCKKVIQIVAHAVAGPRSRWGKP